MSQHGTPIGVILAGGASRRMGTDKAFVGVDGRSMVVRVAEAMSQAGCSRVVCQGGNPDLATSFGLEVLLDSIPGSGPVVAILTALEHHDGPIVVAACDLVDLDAAAVRAVAKAGAADPSSLVSVATADGRVHLLSYWSRAALVPLAALVADGVTSYRVALERLAASEVPVDPAAVRNINRPEDLV